ncbi:MAG: type II secretion system protein [Rhodospirillaceae bacterium]
MKTSQQYQAGFSGLQMVIVVAILGFTFVMALKGRDLVHAMRGLATINKLRDFQLELRTYEAQYRAPPGDDPAAPRRWGRENSIYIVGGVGVSMAGDQRISGLLSDYGNATGEQFDAWRDLRFSGLLDGDTALVGQSAMPENLFGGHFGFAEDNFGLKNVICTTQIPGDVAQKIDERLDDGTINAGAVRATSRWDPIDAKNHFDAPDEAPYDPLKTYIICVPQRV